MAYISKIFYNNSIEDGILKSITLIKESGIVVEAEYDLDDKGIIFKLVTTEDFAYVCIKMPTTTSVQFDIYKFWDSVNDEGIDLFYTKAITESTIEHASIFFVGADANFIFITFRDEFSYTPTTTFLGIPDVPLDRLKLTISTGISAGTNVSISVPDPTIFNVGGKYNLQDSSTGITEQVVISDVIGSLVYLEEVLYNYTDNFYFGYNLYLFIIGDLTNRYFPKEDRIKDDITIDTLRYLLWPTYREYFSSNTQISDNNIELRTTIYLNNFSNTYGYFSNLKSPSVSDAYGAIIGNIYYTTDNGRDVVTYITTSATSNTITDSRQNWTVDEFAGKYVYFLNEFKYKCSRKILSNTATTITFVNPTSHLFKNTQFIIVNSIMRPIQSSHPELCMEDVY